MSSTNANAKTGAEVHATVNQIEPIIQKTAAASKTHHKPSRHTSFTTCFFICSVTVISFSSLHHFLDTTRFNFNTNARPSVKTEIENPLWVQLSYEESIPYLNQDCKNQKFKHCCYGQCRKEINKIDVKKVLWKWNTDENREGEQSTGNRRHLANLTDVLEYMERRKINRDKSCNINFAGASLSKDHVMAATCQLTNNAGYELTSCNTTDHLGKKSYGTDSEVSCQSSDYDIPHFVFENKEAKACPKVVVSWISLKRKQKYVKRTMMKMLRDESFENGFVNVYNWGVHCNDHDKKCLSNKIEKTLIPFVNNTKYDHWRFLFREHEPQHFNTAGGVYEEGKKDDECSAIKGKPDNWRNEEVVNILKRHNLTKKVRIIHLFDALVPLWQLHHPADCTHYCYNPFRFDLTWDGMLNALKEYDQ